MRRHVHAGNHAAESFVSFIPLLDRLLAPEPVWILCGATGRAKRGGSAGGQARRLRIRGVASALTQPCGVLGLLEHEDLVRQAQHDPRNGQFE
jgi:hypothetical protein